jgi:hypothetical protein
VKEKDGGFFRQLLGEEVSRVFFRVELDQILDGVLEGPLDGMQLNPKCKQKIGFGYKYGFGFRFRKSVQT